MKRPPLVVVANVGLKGGLMVVVLFVARFWDRPEGRVISRLVLTLCCS